VVDEAYLSFVEDADSLLDFVDEGLVLLRSMTKDYALAGLRLGYAVAAPHVIEAMATVRPPWSVNALAQAAGLAALADSEHLPSSRRAVAALRALVTKELGRLGLEVLPGAANFLLVRVGNGAAIRSALLAKGVCVRDCTSFGLPDYIRIGLRPPPESGRLVAAMREVLSDS
jgi:histidinol-phosphate aminotransferase